MGHFYQCSFSSKKLDVDDAQDARAMLWRMCNGQEGNAPKGYTKLLAACAKKKAEHATGGGASACAPPSPAHTREDPKRRKVLNISHAEYGDDTRNFGAASMSYQSKYDQRIAEYDTHLKYPPADAATAFEGSLAKLIPDLPESVQQLICQLKESNESLKRSNAAEVQAYRRGESAAVVRILERRSWQQ